MNDIDRTHYHKLATWAESDDRDIDPHRALHGAQAVEASRELLRRAGGRPSIDPARDADGPAPRRQVRLPRRLSSQVDDLARKQGRNPSDVMRDAIAAYVDTHAQGRCGWGRMGCRWQVRGGSCSNS
ncbi:MULTISPECIES: ribbon-helix-helix domain-containing protein [Mycobacterium]|uniref:ribbon-helix-helix domain-containing protein n=1 Tax=Mycobacterium TaxID=1763 RepID=UPI0009DDB261|nr:MULTISPECIES: ribbon-helix-helix domain-containing protein [Mycobacterium]